MTYPNTVVAQGFSTIRYLSQLAEALAYGVLQYNSPYDVRKLIVHCADRIEHIAQEFLPDSFGSWPEKSGLVRQSLLDDVQWMMEVIALDWVQEALGKSVLARPDAAHLTALAAELGATEAAS
ncbi:hypothetical protein LJR296_007996 [Cupriavidus necator]|uniref:hypothetical protein n=1 Tax=Cupriavidus necator TaxID=106590 RepID=UPI003ECE600C